MPPRRRSDPRDDELDRCLELQLTLLSSALHGDRPARLVDPFPPAFLDDDGEPDHAALKACIAALPPLAALTEPRDASLISAEGTKLREWRDGLPYRALPLPIQTHAGAVGARQLRERPPSHQFAIRVELRRLPPGDPKATASLARSTRWERLMREHGTAKDAQGLTVRLYHGSAMENFHSILQHGLKNCSGTLDERTGAAFGSGIYLSDSLPLAQAFAPVQSGAGRTWQHASYGQSLSCVAECEVALHPGVRRPGAPPGNGDPVPNKYWVVENEEHIILRSLLLYGSAAPTEAWAVRTPRPLVPRHRPDLLPCPALPLALVVAGRAEG